MKSKIGTLSLILAVISAISLILFFLLPGRLTASQMTVNQVKATFKTEEERKQKADEAETFGDTVFTALYAAHGSSTIDACLPEKGSLDATILTALSKILQVDGRISVKEDLVPSPPAPKANAYLDVGQSYPMQMKTLSVFISYMQISAAIALVVFGLLAVFLKKKSADPAPPSKPAAV